MKEIGGYFELECNRTPLYYTDGIYLNLCRNGLRYLIRTLGINQIHVPLFTCHVVRDAILKEGCKVITYGLDSNLMPVESFPKDDFILYNNYFGVTGKKVDEMAALYPNLIVDNAQAFFSQPACRAAIYSPRKFFGLPDGGILRGKDIPIPELEYGRSYEVASHLLKRHDCGAQPAYHDFCSNDAALDCYALERMSRLTLALMGNIDYQYTKSKRLGNFRLLRQHLPSAFPFDMSQDDVPMVFPLLMENGAKIREKLIQNNIFCARYWPRILSETHETTNEHKWANDIIAIPCDQRYGENEMNHIIELLH